LNGKCQNSTCHSATSSDALKFDGTASQVYNSVFNVPSHLYTSSVNKYEQLVKPQHPYTSFLLRKIAGAQFDTDLALDSTGEGSLMLDTAGQPLTNIEIEFIRQWIRFGALQTYTSSDPQPDYATIAQYYTDSIKIAFLAKPPKPAPGTGFQFRMGPVFLPISGSYQEQEWLQQQEVNFPFPSEIYKITGYMNQQSHHFLLFKYDDSVSAQSTTSNPVAPDRTNLGQITPSTSGLGVLGANSFEGNKSLTGAWQEDADLVLPQGTALMWENKTYLDMNFHMKNYNATSVLPCDFYFNIYFHPRNPTTVPMKSQIENNYQIGSIQINCLQIPPWSLPNGTSYTGLFPDGANSNSTQTRYLWMAAGHTHKYGTAFYLIHKDETGQLADTIYDGQYNYDQGYDIGYWDHTHPPIEYWPNLHPVVFGQNGSGIVASTTWLSQENCIHFGFTTKDEMQLFYYMYTTQLPGTNGINDVAEPEIQFQVIPNPINTTGQLAYVLDNTSRVEATIMDITGNVIAHMEPETEVQGAHSITIADGRQLAAGVYFARLQVDGSAYTRKFVVTK
jgi:hypothetical protein